MVNGPATVLVYRAVNDRCHNGPQWDQRGGLDTATQRWATGGAECIGAASRRLEEVDAQ
jgi:hypothetical protein